MSWRERLCLDSPGCLGLGGERPHGTRCSRQRDHASKRGQQHQREDKSTSGSSASAVDLSSLWRMTVGRTGSVSGRPESARVARDLLRHALPKSLIPGCPAFLRAFGGTATNYKWPHGPFVRIPSRSAPIIHQSYITSSEPTWELSRKFDPRAHWMPAWSARAMLFCRPCTPYSGPVLYCTVLPRM